MKVQADRHKTERSFQVGDWVWLKLQPYRQVSVQHRSNQKLSQKYYGPFKIIALLGQVAYKLQLLLEARIHNVFHVSQLKPFYGQFPAAIHVPDWIQGSNPLDKPSKNLEAIIDRRFIKVNNVAQIQYLVKWINLPLEEAQWLSADDFEQFFPSFQT